MKKIRISNYFIRIYNSGYSAEVRYNGDINV